MGSNWRPTSIGALCDAGVVELQTGPFGTQLHAHDYVVDGVSVVPTEALGGRRIDHSVLPKVTHTKARELEKHRLRLGDILFARRGVQATGHIGFVREAEIGFLCGTGAIRLRVAPNDELDPTYLSLVLTNEASVEWFKFHAIGATMPNLNEGIIRSFPLSLPPLSEQRAIAQTLSALDDKIDVDRQISATLEAMAKELFGAWFVDFHPVRSKVDGRALTLSQSLADLFPATFEDSDLGPTPRGWKVGRFRDIVELVRDQCFPPSKPNTLFRHFSIPAFDSQQVPRVEYGKNIKSLKWVVPKGVILLAKLNPEIERVWLVDVPANELSICSTEFVVLRERAPYTLSYAYSLTRSRYFRRQLEGLVTGTSKSHQRAQVNSILNIPIVVPPLQIIAAFDRLVDGFLSRVLQCRREGETLAGLRDALLPKLVSGKLQLDAATKTM